MRPTTTATLSTVVAGTAVSVDPSKEEFNVGIGVVITGTIDYTVQYTFDGTTYFPFADLATKTANTAAALKTPCSAVRLNINSVSGGTAYMVVQQAG